MKVFRDEALKVQVYYERDCKSDVRGIGERCYEKVLKSIVTSSPAAASRQNEFSILLN